MSRLTPALLSLLSMLAMSCGGPDGSDASAKDQDLDGDGYTSANDCDDGDDSVHEGAPESCDDIDSDCDGSLVDDFDNIDGDDEPDCIDIDDDNDGDPNETDCEPNDPSIYTEADETCDDIDSDCDGSLVDDFADYDGDGDPDCIDDDADDDGDPGVTDCDDTNEAVYNGAFDIQCNGVDDDCLDGDDCTPAAHPECPTFTEAATYTCEGGIVMTICGQVDANGDLTVRAQKVGPTYTFGDGLYTVWEFDPADPAIDKCHGGNADKAQLDVTGNPTSIVFPAFASLIAVGEEKGYCVAKPEDYNPTHWCSGELTLTYP